MVGELVVGEAIDEAVVQDGYRGAATILLYLDLSRDTSQKER
jgi:hypothetical protein